MQLYNGIKESKRCATEINDKTSYQNNFKGYDFIKNSVFPDKLYLFKQLIVSVTIPLEEFSIGTTPNLAFFVLTSLKIPFIEEIDTYELIAPNLASAA